MIIKARIKDGEGNTIAYDIMNGTEVARLNKDVVIGLFNQITNAKLMPNGEFRANNGCHIDTIVDYNKLQVINRSTKVAKNGENINIDYYGKQFINICKRIRRYASEGKLTLDDSAHKANKGLNTHLFELIDACGINHKDFIIGYLSVIQPYSLKKFKDGGPKGHTWVSDIGYGIELVIKIDDNDKNKPMVISFHESNFDNNFKKSYNDFDKKKCAVIVDDWIGLQPEGYLVKYSVQRGFIRYSKMSSRTKYLSNDIALVDYEDIMNTFDNTMKALMDKLQTTYTSDDETDALEVSTIKTDRMSFMSIGFSVVNNLYLLIDLYSQFTDKKSRAILADIALNIIAETSVDRRIGIKNAINKRFSGKYSNTLLEVIRNI